MLDKELLNYLQLKQLLAYIFFGSEQDEVQPLYKVDHNLEENLFNIDSLNKLYYLLEGSLSLKIFDNKKLEFIRKVMQS